MKNIYAAFILCLLASSVVCSQTFWTGPPTSFSKANFANPNLEENQDRITPNMWITRGNNQSIFNIAQEPSYQGVAFSPTDTEWAFGSIADGVQNLTFNHFVLTLSSNVGDNVLNGPMVLHIISEDIYIDITFTSWSSNGTGGGFSYTRSTDSSLSVDDFDNKNAIKVFPNPSHSSIQVTGFIAPEKYKLFDITGTKLQEGKLPPDKNISIENLQSGLYFIRFEEGQVIPFIKN